MNPILAIFCIMGVWTLLIFAPYYAAKLLLVHLTKCLPTPQGEEKLVCWLTGVTMFIVLGLLSFLSIELFNFFVKSFGN